ncbi:unnamed protein product [Clavelina lepadiformis]|uniref:Uncharacterized protein n=1 Tax=Clavelina lepadiformis TaxID=159417 RepID=A0ABP0FC34_CLALP
MLMILIRSSEELPSSNRLTALLESIGLFSVINEGKLCTISSHGLPRSWNYSSQLTTEVGRCHNLMKVWMSQNVDVSTSSVSVGSSAGDMNAAWKNVEEHR